MSAHILLLLAFFTLSICYFFYNCYLKRRHLPPGPMPLPLFGNVFDFVLDPPGYAPLLKWQKRYGNVFTYWTIGTVAEFVDHFKINTTIRCANRRHLRLQNDAGDDCERRRHLCGSLSI